MMPSNKNALMVPLQQTKRLPELKMRNILIISWTTGPVKKKITEMFLKKLSINSTPLNKGAARALEELSLNA